MPEPLARVLRTSPSGGSQNHCWAPWAAVACPVEHRSEGVARELALGKPGVVEAMPHAWVGSSQAAVDKTDSRVVADDGVGRGQHGAVRAGARERGVVRARGEEVGGCRDMLEVDRELLEAAREKLAALGDRQEVRQAAEVQADAYRLESMAPEPEPRSKAGARLFVRLFLRVFVPSSQASRPALAKAALPRRCPHVRVGVQAWGSVRGSPLLS